MIFTIVIILSAIILILIIKDCLRPKQKSGEIQMLCDQIDRLKNEVSHSNLENRKEIQGRIDVIDQNVNKAMRHQFSETSNLISNITKKMTEVHETNKEVVNFAEQMKSLESILKNPKQRGVLGEYFLETLLSNVLQPNQYKMQYEFPGGEIVDAVIFFNNKVIPIDAKFSLEKYNLMVEETNKEKREELEKGFKLDVRRRIDETSKYISPSNNTTDFAFMFIPAEGIYYNLLIYNVGTVSISTHDLIEYAFKKHVIVVSPTSFYAYLETVLHGLKALKIEESVKEILMKISDLSRHLKGFEVHYNKIGTNLGTTVNMYNSASKEFKKIDKDVYKLSEGKDSIQIEPPLLEKPKEEYEGVKND